LAQTGQTHNRIDLYGFLAGLGIGGCLPTAITLVREFAHKGKASSVATPVMTGSPERTRQTRSVSAWAAR
jgi:hypothetical protein